MPDWRKLIEEARNAQQRAYAPYSNFRVGAALLGASGRIYTGCNVENASYRVTTCAEQGAVSAAVLAGEKEFTHLAIVTDATEPSSPCGACRQALNEFAPALEILSVAGDGAQQQWTLQELLPAAFMLKSLSTETSR